MGYTDAQGRPEWIAQPYVSQGTAAARMVEEPAADQDEAGDEQQADH